MSNMQLFNEDCRGILKSLPDNSVDLIVIDPPYLMGNTNTGGGSKLNNSLQNIFDKLEESNLTNGFDMSILNELVRVNNKINMYLFCNKAQLPMLMSYFVNGKKCSFDLIKYHKTNAAPTFSNKYNSDTEYVLYVRKGGYCKPACYEDASTLYQDAMNTGEKHRWGHPTVKPLPLVERLIRNSSKEGDTVLDCFLGSGTTAVACKKLNRDFIGVESNKKYFDIAINRINTKDQRYGTN
ncbi:Methyltransferase [Vibrio chagasii]|nr:Methyltransferase [Vibrio chagasii]CAH7474385.1 Methyltransferase [Vibrio chagasii]